MKNPADEIKTNQLLRLVWIEWFASKHGRINRADIAKAWGPSTGGLPYFSTIRERQL